MNGGKHVNWGRRSTDHPHRFRLAIATVLSFIAIVSFGWGAGRFTGGNCKRIHVLVTYLDRLVASGDKSLRLYYEDGTITSEQLDRGIEQSKFARQLLHKADCQ